MYPKISSTPVDWIMLSKQVLSTRDQIDWVKLSKLYTRKEIPVDPSEVTTPLKLKKWSYLDCIAGNNASDDAVSSDVLIGANCTKTLEINDFIASKNGGPYTLETVLGWCVVGHIGNSCKQDNVISCNRTAIQDARTKQISRHKWNPERSEGHSNKWHNAKNVSFYWISSNQELTSRISWQTDWMGFLIRIRSCKIRW